MGGGVIQVVKTRSETPPHVNKQTDWSFPAGQLPPVKDSPPPCLLAGLLSVSQWGKVLNEKQILKPCSPNVIDKFYTLE